MPRKRSTTPKGQLSLWGELTAPADALAGAPGLAEPKRRPASAPVAGKVEPLPAQNPAATAYACPGTGPGVDTPAPSGMDGLGYPTAVEGDAVASFP